MGEAAQGGKATHPDRRLQHCSQRDWPCQTEREFQNYRVPPWRARMAWQNIRSGLYWHFPGIQPRTRAIHILGPNNPRQRAKCGVAHWLLLGYTQRHAHSYWRNHPNGCHGKRPLPDTASFGHLIAKYTSISQVINNHIYPLDNCYFPSYYCISFCKNIEFCPVSPVFVLFAFFASIHLMWIKCS